LSADPAAARDGRRGTVPAGRIVLGLVAALLLLRLATLGAYPLMDTSEARYGEIARVMLESGDWVTPQETQGTPFWAKPPLSTWLSAASMRIFGVDEFALRLPALLCALLVLALGHAWANALPASGAAARSARGLLAVGLLATSAGFFVAAGTVMTDPSLALCSTAMLASFHLTALHGSRALAWRYGFFVAAGLGMLAKGPVILLYAGAPIGLWTVWNGRWRAVWQALPWFSGTLLAALICVPWYALAEARTPGFLAYFLVGEHFNRFLVPGWSGDRYGTAHAEPLGTIWLYLAGALGGNAALLLAAPLRAPGEGGSAVRLGAARRLLVLAALLPVLFFSFAGNIIWTYVLPVLAPLAVLGADLLAERYAARRAWRLAILGTLGANAIVVAALYLAWVPRHVGEHSSAALLANWPGPGPGGADALVYVGRKAPASLRFYSRGLAHSAPDLDAALAGLGPGQRRYLAVPEGSAAQEMQRIGALEPPLAAERIAANRDLVLLRVMPH